jgi:phosphoserine phosphatase
VTRIYLVRHGETDWNRDRRLQGILNVGLNKVGITQGRRIAKRFSSLRALKVYTSPLTRAIQTATLLQGHGRDCPVMVEPRLREIDHGAWTGVTMDRIACDFPEEFEIWQSMPDRVRPRGGESLQEAYRRATGFLHDFTKTSMGSDVLIVSHGVINALLLCAAWGAPPARLWDFPQPNADVTVLRVEGRKVVGIKREEGDHRIQQ